MYYIYVLKSLKDGSTYIGYTKDLKERFEKHNKGRSRFTKARRPYQLLYYEAYISKTIALRREKALKRNSSKKEELFDRIMPPSSSG